MMVWAEEYGLQIERKFCKHSYILDLLDPIVLLILLFLLLLLLKDFFYDVFNLLTLCEPNAGQHEQSEFSS